jgi:DNA-binding NtrC family response regulator
MATILVVDDEQANLDELEEALTDEGHKPICKRSVDDAMAVLYEHEDICLVITDLKMPGKSGMDLARIAQTEFERTITFMIMSGHGSPSADIHELESSHIFLHKKPLDLDQFTDAVEMELAKLRSGI